MILVNNLSLKNQRKTLKIIDNLCDSTRTGVVCRPVNFTDYFSFLDSLSLVKMLKILESKNLIKVDYADFPDNFNIYTLQVTPDGLNFEPQISYDTRQKWTDRAWGFITGTLLAIVLQFLLGLL